MVARAAGRAAGRRKVYRRPGHPAVRGRAAAGGWAGELLQEEVMESQTIDSPETSDAAAAEISADATPYTAAASAARASRGRRAALAAFTPVVTAAIALGSHRGVTNRQHAVLRG